MNRLPSVAGFLGFIHNARMGIDLRWTGKEAADLVGRTRALCYAAGVGEAEVYQQRLAADPRVTGDDLLTAERDGLPVGTATSYSQTMWVRGRPIPCQGVAYVGTIKTHRRSGGVASAIMNEVLRKGRERGQVVSALMPFRASFYEHFGYGLIERRATWTIPLSVMPSGTSEGFRVIQGADPARVRCRQRMVEAGQCDIERSAGAWAFWTPQEGGGYVVGDWQAGEMASWLSWSQQKLNGKDILVVEDSAYESLEAFRRALCFLGTLRDQYWGATLTVAADFPLNRLLKESQVPHRPVNHDVAEVKSFTRMQVRVLDHLALLNGMRVPAELRGQAVVGVQECDGSVSRFKIDFENGRASASLTSVAADLECSDVNWAPLVLGDMAASRAASLGLVRIQRPDAVALLDGFARGPAPFCNEYF